MKLVLSLTMLAVTSAAGDGAGSWGERQRESARRQESGLARQRVSVSRQTGQRAESVAAAPGASCDRLEGVELGALVERHAVARGLPAELLSAVIGQESAGKPCAMSRAGALGLMQLMPTTAAQFGVQNPFDPEENVGAGSALLRQLLERYDGNLAFALAAYNSGPRRVDAAGGIPRIPETQDYVRTILGQMEGADLLLGVTR